MSFNKVTSNEDFSVGLKSITIFIFILKHFYENISHAVNFVMETIEEQRVCVKFCFKLEKNASKTFEHLQ